MELCTDKSMDPMTGDKWDGVFPGIRMKWAVGISGMHDRVPAKCNWVRTTIVGNTQGNSVPQLPNVCSAWLVRQGICIIT